MNPRWSTGSKAEAFDFARQCCDASTDPRIVRLTPKKKPKVMAKLVRFGLMQNAGVVYDDGESSRWWYEAKIGKRVRITLEELADE